MADPYNNGAVTWNANQLDAARNWFQGGKTAAETQARASEIGLSNTQLENLWNQTMTGQANPFTPRQTSGAAQTTTQAGATTLDLTQTVYNSPNGITDGANPHAPQANQRQAVNWGNYDSANQNNYTRLATAGNLAVVRDGNGALQMHAVDGNGTRVNNGAASMDAANVARLIAQSGLHNSPTYRQDMASLAQQLDAAGVQYRPGQLYAGTGSNHGVDLNALANAQLGGGYNWTVDPLAHLKGPTAMGSLRDNQLVAQILGLTGANSGLLGQNIPSYNPLALGNGTGGIAPVNRLPGQTGGTGTATAEELAEFRRGFFDLVQNPILPGDNGQRSSGRFSGNDGIGSSQPNTYGTRAATAEELAALQAAQVAQQPNTQGGMLSSSINMGNGQWNVTPDQLVENRLQNLLDDDNPLVQMARTQGLQDAQSRGLLNSSLGAQAGALAAYQYAMPVAQQDATTYGNAARTNAENAVQMQMQQAGFGHDANMARINEGIQSRLSAQGAQQELARLNQAHRNTLSQTSVQQQNWMQQSYLSQMNNYQNSLAQYTQRIQEADMPADQKTAQINELMQTYSNLINWSNASYGQMPQWVSQWSTLAPTIESR